VGRQSRRRFPPGREIMGAGGDPQDQQQREP
jgi:hypothetical protein